MNSLIKPVVPSQIWDQLPHFCQCWLRNFVFAAGVYFGVGFIWAYYIYMCFGTDLFPNRIMPTWPAMFEQMNVSLWSLPIYSLLPSITEELCARGFTLAYAHVSDVGRPRLVGYLFLYMAFVEFGVYWMHRGLHDIPAGYKCALLRFRANHAFVDS
jgi:lathosterol oxidase